MRKFRILMIVLASGVIILSCSSSGTENKSGDSSVENNKQEISNGSTDNAGTESGAGKPIKLNKASFKEKVWNYEENPETWVYKGDKPAVIDFYADWCKPCRQMAPMIDRLAKEYDGEVVFYKVDVQVEQELSQVFQINGIPAFLFISVSGQPTMQAGAIPENMFRELISKTKED